MCDLHEVVIDHARQMISWPTVRFKQDEVVGANHSCRLVSTKDHIRR